MKKTMMLVVAAMALAAFAVIEDSTILTFSTVGPDYYADGGVVTDGEYYALIWRDGSVPFSGFNVDGTLVNANTNVEALLYAAPLAEDGHCPETRFVVDGGFRNESGSYLLCLLDTRQYAANGTVTAGGDPLRVQGYATVTNAHVGFSHVRVAMAKPDYEPSVLPDDVPTKPVVTAIAVDDDQVEIAVTNTSDLVNYTLIVAPEIEPGMTFAEPNDIQPRTGNADPNAPIVLIAPRAAGETNRFYKVLRKPME